TRSPAQARPALAADARAARPPTAARRVFGVAPLRQPRRGYLRCVEPEAEREVQLVADVEAHEVTEGAEGPARREEVLELFERERAQLYLERALLVPHARADDGVHAEPHVLTRLAYARPLALFERVPASA